MTSHHSLVTFLSGDRTGYYMDFGTLADLAKSLESVYVYDGGYSEHRDRHHGRTGARVAGMALSRVIRRTMTR